MLIYQNISCIVSCTMLATKSSKAAMADLVNNMVSSDFFVMDHMVYMATLLFPFFFDQSTCLCLNNFFFVVHVHNSFLVAL